MESMETASRKKKIIFVTLVGFVVNCLLVIFKFIAGILGNSGAMVADAVHSLSDFMTDIVVLVFIGVASKPRDETHRYGHGKFETLATAIIGVVLFFVGMKLLLEGGNKVYGFYFRGEALERPGMIALAAALISIVAKEILYRYTAVMGKLYKSQSVIANAWHHRSDALSSIGTALGIGGAILLGDQWRVLDPIAAIAVSVLIVVISVKLILPAMDELLERSLPANVEQEILDIVHSTPDVSHPHGLRTRRIGNDYAIEMHIRVDGGMSVDEAHELTKIIEERICEKFGETTHISLHVEPVKKILA